MAKKDQESPLRSLVLYNHLSMIEEIEKVKESLGKTLRIKMDDGRVIQGEFQCMDKDLNFIIGSATEYHGMTNRAF